ncbi:hypothetical protein Tco_1047535, partial [Tanacetum coccineum]
PSGSSDNIELSNNLDVGAMKLALQARNKFSFVDGSCLKESYATSNVLSAQWDRCNAIVLTWIMNSVSQDVYMGLVYSDNAAYCSCDASKELVLHQQLMKLMQFLMSLDDCYQPIRSALLTMDPLPEVKDAYTTVSREESHRGIPKSSGVSESKLNATSFAAKSFNNNRRCFEIVGFPPGFKRNTNTVKQGFNVNVEMQKLLSLINDKSTRSIHANMAGANQHLIVSTISMFSIVDVTSLKITVGHPNGTLATISHVGNLKLSNNVILYDVLVVPGYCVRLEKGDCYGDW